MQMRCSRFQTTVDISSTSYVIVFNVLFRFVFLLFWQYSGPSLSGPPLQRPPPLMWPHIYVTTTLNTAISPSHQRPRL